MATEPNCHPVDEEIAQVLADNPGLLEELQEADRAYDKGELELVGENEVRRMLESKGIRLSPGPSDPVGDQPPE